MWQFFWCLRVVNFCVWLLGHSITEKPILVWEVLVWTPFLIEGFCRMLSIKTIKKIFASKAASSSYVDMIDSEGINQHNANGYIEQREKEPEIKVGWQKQGF